MHRQTKKQENIVIIRNLRQTKSNYFDSVMGYDVFIPSVYYNPLSFNRKGCPVWVKTNDDGDCIVFIQEKDNNLNEEIVNFIMNNLPKKPSLHCCRLTASLMKTNEINSNDKYALDCACVDEDDNIHAYITIGDGLVGARIEKTINKIWYDNTTSLMMLRNYLLREENIKEHRGEIIWHSEKEDGIIEILHFMPSIEFDGFFYYQFE